MASSTAFTVGDFETGHKEMIHDAQMNFVGSKLATCSCDKTVRVFDVNVKDASKFFLAELKGHQGPVWQVAWAHPSFGTYLASCSYDRKVIIWKETPAVEPAPNGRMVGKWDQAFVYEGHDSSVNSVSWAPPEWGQMLAFGSSDSCITVLSYVNDRWVAKKIPSAHAVGVNAVSWAPAEIPSFGKTDGMKQVKRFASGGCDNLVKIWREENDHWVEETKLEGHNDWVRDVAWSPSAGLSKIKIASCSQDRTVIIWTNKKCDGISYTMEPLRLFEYVIWHISWNFVGDVLAVSGGDNQVSLWKQRGSDDWECISDSSKLSPDEQRPKTDIP